MNNNKQGMHGIWKHRWTFVLAATGSAVGLGNIWKFPYITGENGGGAFVLVYLACILCVGVPVMMAEALIGRKGRMSPINSMKLISKESNSFFGFKLVGWMGALAGFIILSFYTVIAGWALIYVVKLGSGVFTNASSEVAGKEFGGLLSNPWLLLVLHSLFTIMVGLVSARGVHKGLESSSRLLMPLLFIMLVVLFGYSLSQPGFGEAFSFMFNFDFDRLTANSVIIALGHSFFTLSLGMGAIMAYGSYMPREESLSKTVITVASFDTLIALISGLIIFSIVFTNGLEPSAGPGLLFQTIPLAFGSLPFGSLFGVIFFLLIVIAAWSSAFSISEPVVAWAVEKGFSRLKATIIVCGLTWLLGIGSLLSFNEWGNYQSFVSVDKFELVETTDENGDISTQKTNIESHFYLYADVSELKKQYPAEEGEIEVSIKGKTFFDLLDFITANIMLPLGGLLIALFVGWSMKPSTVTKEAQIKSQLVFNLWRVMTRFISPLAILYIFISQLS